MSSTQPQAGNCPNCGYAASPGSRFCMNCAFDLSQAQAGYAQPAAPQLGYAPAPQIGCPNCGAQLGPGASFCGNCGTSFAPRSSSKKPLLIGGIALLVLAIAGAAVWFFFLRGGSVSVSFSEKLLATIPSEYEVEDFDVEFSLDGTRVVYVAKKQGSSKKFVVTDGKPGKEYDQIRGVSFSYDGSKVGYLAKEGTNTFIVVNGEEKKIDYSFEDVRMMSFNPGTNRVEYLVKSNDRSFMVVDDKKKETPYDEIGGFGYTLDGTLVYQAKNKGSDNIALLINDKVVAESKDVELDLAPDGRTIIYGVEDKNKKSYMVIGGNRLEGYDNFRRVVFGPDGASYCLIATKDGKDVLVKNGKEEPMPDNLKGKTLIAVSSDGSKIAYEESEGGKYRAVVGDKKSESFDTIMTRSAIFSPDASKLAFIANVSKTETTSTTPGQTSMPVTRSKNVVVVGDQKSEEFDEIYAMPFGRLSFNSGGSKVAFGARKGNDIWWKVMDVK